MAVANGLHALLHLVRASLQHDRDSDLAGECLFIRADLREEPDVSSPKAAISFLRNRHNLECPIFPNLDDIRTEEATSGGLTTKIEYGTSSSILLKDRVNDIMYILEQLTDYQATLDRSKGIPLRLMPRSQLEGYRFMDIAARRPLRPRYGVRSLASNGQVLGRFYTSYQGCNTLWRRIR